MQSISNGCTDAIVQPTSIRVVLRLKPLIDEAAKLSYVEDGAGSLSLQDFPQVAGKATFFSDANDTNKFRFNKVYDVGVRQQEVCEDIIGDNVMELLAGFNVSIMAFGSEGSGKTYTMFGNDHEEGIVQRMCQSIFDQLDKLHEDSGNESTISINFFELFAENVYDLLSLQKNSKVLKTSSDTKTHTLSVKGLRTVSVNSVYELLAYINEGHLRRCHSDSHYRKSRSSAFLNITVEQRNKKEETLKHSVLQLIDLASSDKLDKNLKYDISTDEMKSTNSSMQNLHQVVYGLSELESPSSKNHSSKHTHRTSRLAKFLQQAIGGDSKTTAVMLSSTDKADRENTVITLSLGSRLRSIHNFPVQNKMGLNSKALLDLRLKNMSTREDSYLTRIKYLEDEVSKLGGTIQQNKNQVSTNKSLTEKNMKLMDQLELYRKSQQTQKSGSEEENLTSQQNGRIQNEMSEVLDNLMEKCERVIQLQMRLDEELRQKSQMSQQLNYKESKAQALEAMNVKLLEQLNTNENEMRNVLNTNSILRKEMEKWMHVAKTRSEKIEELQNEIQERQVGNVPQNGLLFPPGELNHIRDASKNKKGNWLFGNSSNNALGTRKISNLSNSNNLGTRKVSNVSTSSAVTINSQESNSSKTSHRGLNLHAVRLPSGIENENSSDKNNP
ncbi:ZYRO0E01078p [Zygosaccharomyces rouxii]|uniref:ZYRO0E01078p n=1 Tax=Zygosaccharomyces rouxii (strain ATCC 2623 / CBS 732 / NBRC 1130 / NCYC 568 / NRRL Y-229) TaxID=559307 RepID=C5E3X7_ZYGRC|nr:uncharacterized protein ZYRO0E01078g [Zygosaccharomyces rouxii]KAH9198399.1 P-loop containing nucleoside triphosphate hydrolase protein [Zygosaccharomyces rouxii]CAR30738.1 ZYRO0E01078p [Zygosaccharomyces rouxii]